MCERDMHTATAWQLLKRTRAEKNSRKPLCGILPSLIFSYGILPLQNQAALIIPPMPPGIEESWGISNRSRDQVKIIFPPSVIRMDAAVPGKIITEVC